MDPIEPDVGRYLGRVVVSLERSLGTSLVGVFLHGSLAMGTFDPGRSDVDVIAVCAEPLARARRLALGGELGGLPRPASGGDLEFSLVTDHTARTPSPAPPFEVHVSTHEDPAIVDGRGRTGDVDLVVHFAMTRTRGRALIGPDPVQVFLEPDRILLIRAFLSDLRWAREHGAAGWEGHRTPELTSFAYRVLNAARSWRFVETGQLGSKPEGAAWVRGRQDGADVATLLDAALAIQRGGTPEVPADRDVEAFVGRVEAMLQREIRGEP